MRDGDVMAETDGWLFSLLRNPLKKVPLKLPVVCALETDAATYLERRKKLSCCRQDVLK